MNYLLPAKRNWLLPLPTKETKMRMTTSPLSLKVAALESDMDRLEKEMAATLEKTTAAQLATARIRDPSRWADAGGSGNASGLSATPPGDGADNEQPDNETAAAEFDALVHQIAARDGIPLDQATTRARQEYPDEFAALNRTGVAKSYRELVAAEIAKGCSDTVARQRINYAHPELARESIESIAKGSRVSEFMSVVDAIKKRDGVSRVEAMARARREDPQRFERFQNV